MRRVILVAASLVLLSGCFFIRVRDEGGDDRGSSGEQRTERVE